MKSIYLLFPTLVAVIFLGFLVPQARANDVNNISIQNISVQPDAVKVGDTFTVTATLVNNSTVPIVVEGGTCIPIIKDVPLFTLKFDNHTKIKYKYQTCAGVGLSQILDPGKKNTGTSPDYTLNYTAVESGTANVTVTFQYHVKNQDLTQPNIEHTISKSFQFLIHDINETSTQKSTDFSNHNLQIYKIKEKNYEFFLPYTITNSKIQNMTVDCPSMSMIIHLTSTSANGTLTIGLPRSLLDIKTQTGDDDNFSILVNGMEINYFEINKNQDARTLSIPFSSDAMEIEIIGIAIGQNIPVVPHFCGMGGTNESSYYRLLSPLQQFQSGIDANDVKCVQGLQLVTKAKDSSPACVKSDTAKKLLERGWVPKISSSNSYAAPTKILSQVFPTNAALSAGEPSVKGYLTSTDGTALSNKQINIIIDNATFENGTSIENILVGKTSTDQNGCFYFADWNQDAIDRFQKDMAEKTPHGAPTDLVSIKAVFTGDSKFQGSSNATKFTYYTIAVPIIRPALSAFLVNGSDIVLEQGKSYNFTDFSTWGEALQLHTISIEMKNLPCGIYEKTREVSVTNNQTQVIMPIELKVEKTAPVGNFTTYISVNNQALEPINLEIK